jgi:intein-encoded DNA endonuclease-like protein
MSLRAFSKTSLRDGKKQPYDFQISAEEAAYIAGFFDGEGSIILQIIRQKTYTFGFTIRISMTFFQKSSNHWFLLWLKEKLGNVGYLKKRTDNMMEYTIASANDIKRVLLVILPYLRIKKKLGQLTLSIIEKKPQVKTRNDFLEVCQMVDKAVFYTDSKKRRITSKIVEDSWKPPVETLDVTSKENSPSVQKNPG